MHQLSSQPVPRTAAAGMPCTEGKSGMAQVYLHYPYERTVEPLARATEKRFGMHLICAACLRLMNGTRLCILSSRHLVCFCPSLQESTGAFCAGAKMTVEELIAKQTRIERCGSL